MSDAERILWSKLRQRQVLGHKFRRQYSVGRFVLDFYSAALKLAIEVDGESHLRPGAREFDRERDTYIEGFGIRFLRFTTTDVRRNLNGVVTRIYEAVEQMRGTRQ